MRKIIVHELIDEFFLHVGGGKRLFLIKKITPDRCGVSQVCLKKISV